MNRISVLVLGIPLIITSALRLSSDAFSKSTFLPSRDLRISQHPNLTAPVQKGSKTTYADLLRTLFPDLKVDRDLPGEGTAHKTVPIKHIGEQDEGTVLEGDF